MQNFEKENEADFHQENLVEISAIFNSENKLGKPMNCGLYFIRYITFCLRIHSDSEWIICSFVRITAQI